METEPNIVDQLWPHETPAMRQLRLDIGPNLLREEFIVKLGEYQDHGQRSLDSVELDGPSRARAQVELSVATAKLRLQAGQDPHSDLEDALMAAEAIGDFDLADQIQAMIEQS